MNEKTLRTILKIAIVIGVILVVSGVLLAVFTDATTKGVDGIFLVAGLIAGGLFISVPSKIYLTLVLMQLSDKKH